MNRPHNCMDHKPDLGGRAQAGQRFTCPVCKKEWQIAAEGPGQHWEEVERANEQEERAKKAVEEALAADRVIPFKVIPPGVTYFVIMIEHNPNKHEVHMHNGEVWTATEFAHAKVRGETLQSDHPKAKIKIMEMKGPPGKTLEQCKAEMLELLKKIKAGKPPGC